MQIENDLDPKDAPQTSVPVQAKVEKEESLWDLIRFALIVLLIAIGLRYFVAQPFVVSGSSMVPTFQDKNYLIVDELTYDFSAPQRGDVLVFHPPGQPKGVYYIKRVVGLPGETINIANGNVTIINAANPNGIILKEPYISAPTTANTPSGVLTETIPAGEYFMMGDNRPYSSDSRAWGLLPKANIVGRVFLRLYPFNEISALPGAYRMAN